MGPSADFHCRPRPERPPIIGEPAGAKPGEQLQGESPGPAASQGPAEEHVSMRKFADRVGAGHQREHARQSCNREYDRSANQRAERHRGLLEAASRPLRLAGQQRQVAREQRADGFMAS